MPFKPGRHVSEWLARSLSSWLRVAMCSVMPCVQELRDFRCHRVCSTLRLVESSLLAVRCNRRVQGRPRGEAPPEFLTEFPKMGGLSSLSPHESLAEFS